ncbi:MAG: hypothetical protein ACLQPD_13995 [Desulfomonilaceae bacterium]
MKRCSVKENASPGEEIIIVALLRYGRDAYLLRLCRYSEILPGLAISGIPGTGIPGTPSLIHERAGGECNYLLMAGLASVLVPDRYYVIKGRKAGSHNWLFPKSVFR